MPAKLVKVAVNVPLSREFDYLPGGHLPPAGARVRVPFGRRESVGLVLGHGDDATVSRDKLKRIDEVVDETPLLGEDELWLIRFCASYYHHPVGEVAAAALPALLRQGKSLYPRVEGFRVIAEAGDELKRAPKQAELYRQLADAGEAGMLADVLDVAMLRWRPLAKALVDKGFVERFETDGSDSGSADLEPAHGPELHDEQQAAVDAILGSDAYGCFVLDGVTGSGKTEVYLRLIEATIERGEQVLVLVPEIGLTPQLVNRFKARLGVEPALLHSALTDLERLVAWRRARSGDAKLVVGTRSAVFTPLAKPGLIIVDEEHDQSLKQQEGFRYSARDLAVARANRHDIPVILGSATPSLELLAHCDAGRYTRLPLTERAGGAMPPDVKLIDLSRDSSDNGLSGQLLGAIERHLDEDGQALLFLNRRGFAPTLICSDCGHVAGCERCDARMTVHARQSELRCHHCGSQRPAEPSCPECGADMRSLGEGTERLEEALNAHFPDRTIRRIDSDSVSRKGAIGEALEAAIGGDADILVGTQMLSKGHHFPKLTLVGIINADQGLFGSDFRASERLAQSIIQVAGRAGREQRRGEVLIQTAFPEHHFWSRLLEGGYHGIAGDALAERQALAWPPYSRLALLRASAHRENDARQFLEAARRLLRQIENLEVLGPVNAPMARRAGRHRVQLLLRTSERAVLHRALGWARPQLEDLPEARKVRWSVDVDPIDLL